MFATPATPVVMERHPMRRALRSLPTLGATLALAAAVVLAVGCAKKLPSGPVGSQLLSYPEGNRDTLERTPSELVVWSDVPLTVEETSSDSTIIPRRTFTVYRTGPGVMHGVVVDYVQASGYQLFRSEDGGGYRAFTDYALTAARRWSDRSYYGAAAGALVLPPAQFFAFSDPFPAATPLKSYVGRALIAGMTGSDFPLTNLGAAPDTAAIPPMLYTGLTGLPGNPDTGPAPPDSLLDLSWQAVPGAASYWVHIFQKRADIRTSEEAIAIGHPSPIATGKVRDLFIGYFPAPRTSYKLGDPVPTGSRVLVYRVLQGLVEVFIRVSAVDASGRLIATTGSAGDTDAVQERFGQVDRRRVFLIGAKRVTPARPLPPD
jgi:hypothetical protein